VSATTLETPKSCKLKKKIQILTGEKIKLYNNNIICIAICVQT